MAIENTTLLNSNKTTAVDPEEREAALVKDSGITANLGKTTTVKDTSVFDKAIAQKTYLSPTGTPKPQQRSGRSGTTGAQPVNAYSDIAGNKEGYTPNSESLGNTGAGAEAALGTDYTWNQQGSTEAQKKYESDVLEQKQALLNNRQTMETNAVNYQTQTDMLKYQNNQNAEKVGWTGGYVLDQNRQMDYLKASIQAQMYGAMELQKYGYDSSLAAARLSYDLNQQEYARQYYEQAVSTALSEAQLTGTYFSAETKDMMSQLAVARQKAADDSLKEEEREQANKLIGTIEGWFQENGISKEGVKTLEAWTQDQSNELNWSNELWTRYNATLESMKEDISENPSQFIKLDENGKEIWDGVNITTGNWDSMSGQDILDYLKSGTDGAINIQAMQQYYSYLDSTLSGQLESGFAKWCQTKNLITVDENGNTQLKTSDFRNQFNKYVQQSGIIKQITSKFADVKWDEDLANAMYNWDFTIEMPDGTSWTSTYEDILNMEYQQATADGTEQGETITYNDSDGNQQTVEYKYTSYSLNNGKTGLLSNDYHKTTMNIAGSDVKFCFTTGKVTNVDDPNESSFDEDDIEVKLYADDASGTGAKSGYGVEVAEDGGAGWITGTKNQVTKYNSELAAYYKASTGRTLSGGEIIVMNGDIYFYNSKSGGPYKKGNEGLYKVQQQCDSTGNLASALKSSGQWTD